VKQSSTLVFENNVFETHRRWFQPTASGYTNPALRALPSVAKQAGFEIPVAGGFNPRIAEGI
jgi:hypothetical protein